MTKVLEKAFDEASKLSESEQNSLGEWLLAEIQSEGKWDHAFARSQDLLSRLAKEAKSRTRIGVLEASSSTSLQRGSYLVLNLLPRHESLPALRDGKPAPFNFGSPRLLDPLLPVIIKACDEFLRHSSTLLLR